MVAVIVLHMIFVLLVAGDVSRASAEDPAFTLVLPDENIASWMTVTNSFADGGVFKPGMPPERPLYQGFFMQLGQFEGPTSDKKYSVTATGIALFDAKGETLWKGGAEEFQWVNIVTNNPIKKAVPYKSDEPMSTAHAFLLFPSKIGNPCPDSADPCGRNRLLHAALEPDFVVSAWHGKGGYQVLVKPQFTGNYYNEAHFVFADAVSVEIYRIVNTGLNKQEMKEVKKYPAGTVSRIEVQSAKGPPDPGSKKDPSWPTEPPGGEGGG